MSKKTFLTDDAKRADSYASNEEIMLERQREGILKAKAEGKYKGRKTIQSHIKQDVIKLVSSGESKVEVSRKLGIGEATVYRIMKSSAVPAGDFFRVSKIFLS